MPIEKDTEENDITVSKETFMEKGSVRRSRVNVGDGIKDDIQIVGLISDMELNAECLPIYKREHWKLRRSC